MFPIPGTSTFAMFLWVCPVAFKGIILPCFLAEQSLVTGITITSFVRKPIAAFKKALIWGFSFVDGIMPPSCYQFQVFKPIISTVSVLVMYLPLWGNRAICKLPKKSVFSLPRAINKDLNVTVSNISEYLHSAIITQRQGTVKLGAPA